jgi:hypothetical protein
MMISIMHLQKAAELIQSCENTRQHAEFRSSRTKLNFVRSDCYGLIKTVYFAFQINRATNTPHHKTEFATRNLIPATVSAFVPISHNQSKAKIPLQSNL